MAWTQTKVARYPVGNHFMEEWKLVADSASSELITGLKVALRVNEGKGSVATASRPRYALNVLSGATAQGGAIAIISCASGDELYVSVLGN